jgi:hypothetical protein
VWDVATGKLLKSLEDTSVTKGFGLSFEMVPAGIQLTNVAARSPADEAGLKTGNIVRAINKTPLKGLTRSRVETLLDLARVGVDTWFDVLTDNHATRQVNVIRRGGAAHALSYSPPDARLLAVALEDGSISLWEPKTSIAPRYLRGHKKAVRSIAFSPDGRLLASAADDGQTRLWRVPDGSEFAILPPEHDGVVTSVCFSTDGRFLFTGSADRTVRLWNIAALSHLSDHNSSVALLQAPSREANVDRDRAETPEVAQNRALSLMSQAAQEAWSGREKEYAETCQRALELGKSSNDPLALERVAKACLLRSDEDAERVAASLVLARKAVQLGQWHRSLPCFEMALGMAEFRSGHAAQADAALIAAMKSERPNSPIWETSAFYRAMNLFREGQRDEAHKLATKAVSKMKPLPGDQGSSYNHDDLIVWMTYKEARQLLKLDSTSAD